MTTRTGIPLLLALLAGGCLNTMSVKAVPDADLSEARTFHVVERDTDKQDIHIIVRDELLRWGMTATAGPLEAMPAGTDVLVTTDDHWYWDMRMYLLELEIVFRDPKTRSPLVTGVKKRGSMDAMPPPYVAWETLAGMFEKVCPDLPAPPAPKSRSETDAAEPD